MEIKADQKLSRIFDNNVKWDLTEVFHFSTSDEKLASCVTKVAHQSQPADATQEVT